MERQHAYIPTIHNRLTQLLSGIDYRICSGKLPEDLSVSSITADSRTVKTGSLFVAIKGSTTDGHRFVVAAIEAGARVVIVERASQFNASGKISEVLVLEVARTNDVLASLAARFYGNPAEQLSMIGITGTNGKTTISYLLEEVMVLSRIKTGIVGTVDYRYRSDSGQLIAYPAPHTTPDPVLLHKILREMVDNGVTHVVMEVSSHALRQHRLGPILFRFAIFTNLSQDHLDYHESMADYFAAKCILFEDHMKPGAPVILFDPEPRQSEKRKWSQTLRKNCANLKLPVILCGHGARAEYRYENSHIEKTGMTLRYRDRHGVSRTISSPLIGQFNVENLLVSIAALDCLNVNATLVSAGLAEACGAPGRLQRVDFPDVLGPQPTVLVDYAHTPDALENVLQTVKALPHQTLFCVFGCGGDRDRSKRPLMGRIAATYSDVVVITDDNPRSEDGSIIRKEIASGAEPAGMQHKDEQWLAARTVEDKGCVEIADRQHAINMALAHADQDDIIVIAGKGHETYQITNKGKIFFDDCLATLESALAWTPEMVAAATGGTIAVRGQATLLEKVSTDTRTIEKNDIFVALKGDSFDGHNFLDKAEEGGAGCLVVSKPDIALGQTITKIQVDDTLKALGRMALWRRQALKKMNAPVVVGITGSCGKTTIKEMTAAIFARNWPDQAGQPENRVLKTRGNLNNLVGLPLSLLPASVYHRGIILEMGMNQPGEIKTLTHIADPDIACISNIHGAHLEGLGTIDGVAKAKGELFDTTSENTLHVVNLDDERVVACSEKHPAKKTVYYSIHERVSRRPDIWASDIQADDSGHLSFILHSLDSQGKVTINAPGLHNCSNGCAAAAIAYGAGIDFSTIIEGLEDFRSTTNRMQALKSPRGINLLNDTYNANPASMASALDTMKQLAAGTRIAILGDMLELGPESAELHQKLGHHAAGSDLDFLAVTGAFAGDIANGAREAGLTAEQIAVFNSKEEILPWVEELLASEQLVPDVWILIKASRGLALDTLVKQLMTSC